MPNPKDIKRMFEFARFYGMIIEIQERLRGSIHPVEHVTKENKDDYLFYDEQSEEVDIIDGKPVTKFLLVKDVFFDREDYSVLHYGNDGCDVHLCLEFDRNGEIGDYYALITNEFNPTDMIVITIDEWYVCE